MSESAPPHEPSAEATWLRAHWDEATLGNYEGSWIAVAGNEVRGHDRSIADLVERTEWLNPLYAYVTLMPRQ